jgi:hypothetical protein
VARAGGSQPLDFRLDGGEEACGAELFPPLQERKGGIRFVLLHKMINMITFPDNYFL